MAKQKTVTLTTEDEIGSLFHSLHKQWPSVFGMLDKAIFIGHVVSHLENENALIAKDEFAKSKGHDSHEAMVTASLDEEAKAKNFESHADMIEKENWSYTQTSVRTGHGFRNYQEFLDEQDFLKKQAEKNAL